MTWLASLLGAVAGWLVLGSDREDPGEWNTYAVCPCGERFHAWRGSKFFIEPVVCPRCGRAKAEWNVRVSRYVSQATWWDPRTWGRGYWEDLQDSGQRQGGGEEASADV